MAQFDGMDSFTKGYIIAALWSSTDESGEPLDGVLSVDDISDVTLECMREDCVDFQVSNGALLAQFCEQYKSSTHPSIECAGHDFWLTRNGHGAGFWDRGLGSLGLLLTEGAKAYCGVDLYVGDDGMIYI